MNSTKDLLIKLNINNIPKTSGVYFFYQDKKIIYIGKAIKLKDRIKNHFYQPSYRDKLFIDNISKISSIETNSEIEALILEANLIKKYKPKFNVVWRDDKNYFYVAIEETKDNIPYVYITHQPHHKTWNIKQKTKQINIEYIGPFVEGSSIKKALRFLRKVFPFYTSAKHPKNKCQWCHLDLCPGPNPDILEYKKNIKKLILILKGKRMNVLNSLKKEMRSFSDSRNFENAKKTRDKIYALEQIMANARIISRETEKIESKWGETEKILKNILKIEKPISRIECYDVSNIQGKFATGSMVVFSNGIPDKRQYKKFKIKIKNTPNDIAMLEEIITRRFLHSEWEYPEVILIDGGIAQLNIAIKVKNSNSKTKNIKVISIAKGRQELFIENHKKPIPLKNLSKDIYNLIKNLDDEAHRFAIIYHRKIRKIVLLP